jgi:hypothetical protein
MSSFISGTTLVLYSSERNAAGGRLNGLIRGVVPDPGLRVYRTVPGLSRRLRQPGGAIDLLVLFPADRKDLLRLLGIRHLFMNLRIVLILPDRSGGTIAEGHNLYPRYVSFADGDFSDVAAVLQKMLRKQRTEAPGNGRPAVEES